MVKRSKEIQDLFDQAYNTAMLFGQAFIRYTPDGKMECVDPKQYGELGAALTWASENEHKL